MSPAVQSMAFTTASFPSHVTSLRDEVRAFIAKEFAATDLRHTDAGMNGHSPEFSRKLGQAGWIGMTWPKRWGGHERLAIERYAVLEELLAAGAPIAAHWIADRQTGPLLLRYGTDAQRERFLPNIAAGECYFAIGMSEPNAGSDLAGVQTAAHREAAGWRLSGRKIWTSHAQRAHFMIALCRNSLVDPKDRHSGMTQFIIDLSAPGVEINPIELLTGERHFCEVLLDDVFVPDEMVVGRVGDGWSQVTSELAYERSGPERFLSTFALLVELIEVLGKEPGDFAVAAIGRLTSALMSIRAMSISIAAALDAGRTPAVEAALVKDLGTRLEGEITEVARNLRPCEPSIGSDNAFERLLAESVLSGPGFTLRGGTNEILRGIVARNLGLR